MIPTRFCELFGIRLPIIQAALGGPWRPALELAAAVSNAGALGSLATVFQSASDVQAQIARLRDLTGHPFLVNLTMRPFDPEVFEEAVRAKPRGISFALGDPGDLVRRAHDAGILFVQQVHTETQARRAAELGVDAVIAQGAEAGGFSGTVGTMALVPQVVDAVHPIPVVAAGGIADGRGLGAALALGAQGVNVGTRFMASREATIDEEWKRKIVASESEDAVKAEFMPIVFPATGKAAYDVVPRSLRTGFLDQWNRRLSEVPAHAGRLREELTSAMRAGRAHDYVPITGQSAGLVRDVLPAAEIVHRMMSEAEEALSTILSQLQGHA
ncbi:MAG TPA: nitronate monooxygenase [Candidatus Eisenbacteria bacterium]